MFRKNTASQFIHFQGVDATTGGIKSGVTWTIRRCIDGTFAAGGGTVTEDGTTGWYKYAMAQADTNGNNIGFNFTGTGAVPQTVNIVTTACDPTSTAFGLSIAKTTNITGFNDISVASIWQDTTAGDFTVASSIGKSIMNGVALGTGLTVNALTTNNDKTGYGLSAAAVSSIWQDTTAGDFTVASSIGKALYINNVAPGGAGGLLISGSNAGTTTLGALTITGATTHTGNVVLSDGLTISAPSTLNRAGIDVTGNGTGAAMKLAAGATGAGIAITTTAGNGISVLPTAGDALVLTGNGTSKHGMRVTGGTAGTSDGASFIAGTGGVDIRGNITGNLSGSAGSVTGAVGSVTAAVTVGTNNDKSGYSLTATTGLGNQTANITGNLSGSVGSVTGAVGSVTAAVTVGTNNDKTGYGLSAAAVSAIWQDTTAGDFTVASSIGKSIMNGVALGTGLTVNALTTNNDKTGYSLTATTGLGNQTANITGNLSGSVGSVTGAVGSVTADVGITQGGADKVWSSATRLLTAGTNIVLAKGVGLTGLNDIAATDIVSSGAITTSGGIASSDIKKVNGIVVTGAGTAGNPWGP